MFPGPLDEPLVLFGHVSGPWDETLDVLRHVSGPLEGTLVLLCHVSCTLNEILHLVVHVFGPVYKTVGIRVMCLACCTRQRRHSIMSLDRWVRPWCFWITYSSHYTDWDIVAQ